MATESDLVSVMLSGVAEDKVNYVKIVGLRGMELADLEAPDSVPGFFIYVCRITPTNGGGANSTWYNYFVVDGVVYDAIVKVDGVDYNLNDHPSPDGHEDWKIKDMIILRGDEVVGQDDMRDLCLGAVGEFTTAI